MSSQVMQLEKNPLSASGALPILSLEKEQLTINPRLAASTTEPDAGSGSWPLEPRAVEAIGIPPEFLEDLILKTLFQRGLMEGHEIADFLRLHFAGVTDPILQQLKKQHLVEVKSGHAASSATFRYGITKQGTEKARNALRNNQYVGPCPVTLDDYVARIKQQAAQRPMVDEPTVMRALKDLILSADVLERVGPAVNSFKSLFLYGPPGNGKTTIAKAIGRNLLGDDILVPHAIYADGQIIKVYDPETHQMTSAKPFAPPRQSPDSRWVQCRPPVIIVGGELALRDLDLAYSDASRYYEAPLQLKANGGLFLIDDFGRQQMPPKDLLNRWIVPLEERIDFLTFHTGKKIAVPFETLIIFSTNLPPEGLVDGAFLRRIRHKLGIDYPTVHQYYHIFRQLCQQRQIAFDQDTFIHLVQTYYLEPGRPFQACHPRDLLDQLADFANYRGDPVQMNRVLMDKAARSYFAQLF